MPLYEYQCKKCGHRFEKIQKFSDPHTKKCPECGGAIEQVISAPAVQFKGSGWYVTDYAKKPGTSASSSDGEGSSKESASKDSGATSETKKESKPKAESKKAEKK